MCVLFNWFCWSQQNDIHACIEYYIRTLALLTTYTVHAKQTDYKPSLINCNICKHKLLFSFKEISFQVVNYAFTNGDVGHHAWALLQQNICKTNTKTNATIQKTYKTLHCGQKSQVCQICKDTSRCSFNIIYCFLVKCNMSSFLYSFVVILPNLMEKVQFGYTNLNVSL